jgi:uncharacterized protein (DUF849 family)
VLLTACLNGSRRPGDHPRLPLTPSQIAQDVAAVVAAGADAVHLHVKDTQGSDTLSGDALASVLGAVRAVAPRVPLGVTTGAWALPDPRQRVAAIRSWVTRPDCASVNWHEDGSEAVAAALLDAGVDVEAGLWHAAAVEAWLSSPLRDRCCRVLLELPDGLDEAATDAEADRLSALVRRGTPGPTVLLHGEGSSCWPAVRHAHRRGLQTRIGLEDVLELPDGSPAPDNASLVRAAHHLPPR